MKWPPNLRVSAVSCCRIVPDLAIQHVHMSCLQYSRDQPINVDICIPEPVLRVNPKILALGAGLLVGGFVFLGYLNQTLPTSSSAMTDDEIAELLIGEQEHSDYVTLASILIGLGFLFILISFGTARGEGGVKTRKEYTPPA